MPKRNAHEVLGVEPGASAVTIKAAWRRLAREHHPDITGRDPAATRRATRLMAEINAAYTELSDPVRRAKSADAARRAQGAPPRDGTTGAAGRDGAEPADDPATRPPGAPPKSRPDRPVTARLDMSDLFQPRNRTLGREPATPRGRNPPRPREYFEREGPRASDPTGPLHRGRVLHFRRAPDPTLDEANAHVVEFGKFHGHTLGQIAAFEPSYIDWLARTITRNPELVAAARVIREDLEARGVAHRRAAPAASDSAGESESRGA
jgi:curved DNA-binding protein CbpA